MKLVVIDPAVPQARRWRWTVIACRLAEALDAGLSISEHAEAEKLRVEREPGSARAPSRQLLAKLMKRDDFRAKVDEQLGHLRHEADLVRRGIQRKVENEAVTAIRHQLRREVAAEDGDVTSAARLALEYAGVVGRNAAVNVDARTQTVNLPAGLTPAALPALLERHESLVARLRSTIAPVTQDAIVEEAHDDE